MSGSAILDLVLWAVPVPFSKFYSIFPKEGTLTGKNADSTMEARKVTDKKRIFSQKERKDENGDSCIR